MKPRLATRVALLLPLILAGVCLAVAASGLLHSCKTEDILTPAEKTRADELQTQLDKARVDLVHAQSDALARAQDLGTPKADAAAESAAYKGWAEARAKYLDAIASVEAKDAELQRLLEDAQKRAIAPVAGAIGSTIPGSAPWILLATQLGLPWLFDRSRKHMIQTAKDAAHGNLGDAIAGLGKALGYAHSNTDPTAILEGAEKMAREKGDAELEAAIRALRSGAFTLDGTPAAPTVSTLPGATS
jgi:hypothetical protein